MIFAPLGFFTYNACHTRILHIHRTAKYFKKFKKFKIAYPPSVSDWSWPAADVKDPNVAGGICGGSGGDGGGKGGGGGGDDGGGGGDGTTTTAIDTTATAICKGSEWGEHPK